MHQGLFEAYFDFFSILLFPAVNNYHRFLLHNTVEEYYPELSTVSVGEGLKRRTVIYFPSSIANRTRLASSIVTFQAGLAGRFRRQAGFQAGFASSKIRPPFLICLNFQ